MKQSQPTFLFLMNYGQGSEQRTVIWEIQSIFHSYDTAFLTLPENHDTKT